MKRLAVLLLVSCSDPSPPSVPFDDYAETARVSYCAWAVRCRHVPDEATCRRLLDPKAYDTRRAADGLRLGRLRYDPAAAGSCLAAASASVCPAPPFAHPSCNRVFTGLLGEGQPCTSAYDCKDNGLCLNPACAPGCCVGTCGAARVLPPEPELAGVGGSCRSHEECEITAFCAEDGRCRELPARVGQHCLFGCMTGDLYCDVTSETCRLHPGLGEACSPEAKCNPYWAFCDGVCKARPGPGEPCNEERRCIPSAACVAGTCVPRGSQGAACGRDGDCEIACDADAGVCVGYQTCQAD